MGGYPVVDSAVATRGDYSVRSVLPVAVAPSAVGSMEMEYARGKVQGGDSVVAQDRQGAGLEAGYVGVADGYVAIAHKTYASAATVLVGEDAHATSL